MIGTRASEQQLASIDGATSVGQLADDTVLAVLAWQAKGALSDEESTLLHLVADWLERSAKSLTDPLAIDLTIQGVQIPGLNSFGAGVAELALGLDSVSQDPQSTAKRLEALRSNVLALANGVAEPANADYVHAAFDHIARAMLSRADSLLAPAVRTAWATTVSF